MALPFLTLPSDLFASITDFLSGFDLFSLSHVNRALLSTLLEPNGDVWMKRLPALVEASKASAKQKYCTSRSFSFQGLTHGTRGRKERGGAVTLPSHIRSLCGRSSFSIGLSFALLEAPENVYKGGILLGAQSVHFTNKWWADNHLQFIHVDSQGNLYCSMTASKESVASHLKTDRWYNVVLTYESSSDGRGTQRVYLDGQLVHTSTNKLHDELPYVSNWQLGSGCISGNSKGEPTPGYCGWYGFRGLINDCKVFDRALSIEEMKTLETNEEGAAVWSLQGEQGQREVQFVGDVKRVRCSRPQEHGVLNLSAGVPMKEMPQLPQAW